VETRTLPATNGSPVETDGGGRETVVRVVPPPPQPTTRDLLPLSPTMLLVLAAAGVFALGFMLGFVARGGPDPDIYVVPGGAAANTPAVAPTGQAQPPAQSAGNASAPPPPAAEATPPPPPASEPAPSPPPAAEESTPPEEEDPVTIDESGIPVPETP
jgi:hypothetical protein